MKKIWVINHYATPPDKGTYVRQFELAKHLLDEWSFDVFASSKIHNTTENIIEPKKKIVTLNYESVPFHFIRTRDYSSNGFDRIINMLQFAYKVPFISAKSFGKPDVIYASSPCLFSTFAAVFLSKRYKARLIVEVRDIWPWSIVEYSNKISTKNIVIRALSYIERWIYSQADQIIFTMKGGKDYIRDRGWQKQVPLEKIYYINNGINIDDFPISESTITERKETILLVYAGSLREANDTPRLVESMTYLPDNVKLEIYGSGGDYRRLQEIISEKGIRNVEIKGKVPKREIPKVLAKADAAILHYKIKKSSLLNKYGSSQNKLFEYLASGIPVLSNQEFGYDIVNENECGYAKDCANPRDFANLIIEFLELDSKEYMQMCNNCIETAKRFDWKVLSRSLRNLLQE